MTDQTQTVEDESTHIIQIQGHEFDVGAPYRAGHVVTENEANALNQTRAENIRNNSAGRIKKAAADLKITIPELDLDSTMIGEGDDAKSLRAIILDYASTYEFGARQASSREPADPVQREARRIAVDALADALRNNKMKRKDLSDEQYEQALALYMQNDDIQKEAKRRVAQRAKLGTDALSTLGLSPKTEDAPADDAGSEEPAAA